MLISNKFILSEIKRIKNAFGLNVVFDTPANMKNLFKEWSGSKSGTLLGLYINPLLGGILDKSLKKPKATIYISDKAKNETKVCVLFHELGHHVCWLTGCSCSKNSLLKESHAYLSELFLLKHNGFNDILLNNMLNIISTAYLAISNSKARTIKKKTKCISEAETIKWIWETTITEIVKHKLWKECIKLVGPKFSQMISKNHMIEEFYKTIIKKKSWGCKWGLQQDILISGLNIVQE